MSAAWSGSAPSQDRYADKLTCHLHVLQGPGIVTTLHFETEEGSLPTAQKVHHETIELPGVDGGGSIFTHLYLSELRVP